MAGRIRIVQALGSLYCSLSILEVGLLRKMGTNVLAGPVVIERGRGVLN